MKEIFYIDDTPANRIGYYFLLAFLVTLPFDRFYSELALIGLAGHTLLHPSFLLHPGAVLHSAAFLHPAAAGKASSHNVSSLHVNGWSLSWPGWLVASIYLLTVAGTFYSGHLAGAWPEWEKQLALLLFPLIAWFIQLDWRKYQQRLLKAFAISCLFTVLYLYAVAFRQIIALHLPLAALFSPAFINHAFSAPIDLHATYLSMYCALSLIPCIRLTLQGGSWATLQGGSRLTRVFYGLATLILLAAILQLASRAVCISVIVILNGSAFFFLKGRKSLRFLSVSLLLTLFSLAVVMSTPVFHTRYLQQLRQDLHGVTGVQDDPEPRMARWLCAWELIRASPWIGYGTGTETALLKEKYYEHHLYDSYNHELNAHNQYLSFLLETGLPGLLLYLALITAGFVQAFRSRDPLFAGFLVIVSLVSFSENILEVNKGIFFVSFFFSFFFSKAVTPIFAGYGNKNTLPLVGS